MLDCGLCQHLNISNFKGCSACLIAYRFGIPYQRNIGACNNRNISPLAYAGYKLLAPVGFYFEGAGQLNTLRVTILGGSGGMLCMVSETAFLAL